MTILGLAESVKTMNRPDPADRTHLFTESINDRDVKFYHNIYSSFQFMISKLRIDNFDRLETIHFSET